MTSGPCGHLGNTLVLGAGKTGEAAARYLAGLLGWEAPEYGHVPLLVAPDGRRLSKRDRDLDLGVLREHGVKPERVVGTLGHAVGLVDKGWEGTPSELVGEFAWEKIAAHRDDIVCDEVFLAALLS